MKKLVKIIAILAILAVGVVAGLWILRTEKPMPAGGHGGHGDEAEHEGHGHEEHVGAEHVEMTPEQIKNAGIRLEEAGTGRIRQTVRLFGSVGPNEERLAHVMPRYPGVVKQVRKKLGESVEKGEVLAVIESNESLQPYDVASEIGGTVVEKHITLGEFASTENKIFTIADLGTVWVNLNVYRQDFPNLRVGQKVMIDPGEGGKKIESEIAYISPFGAESTQTMLARAVVENPEAHLRPGLFVAGEVVLDETEVDVAVAQGAIQTLEDQQVVFVREGDAFEVRPVQIGAQDGERAEITAGLLPGEEYVSANSFVLKAELGKAGAAHDH
jgi:cobalt-zinc-cadmium efflux system membrane fusion protein